ncbi:MAG: RlmF-related methyltransferase, partial [Gilliamella sp.]|nr:RlmF-related methyltransferase [Gilliamella sp.]
MQTPLKKLQLHCRNKHQNGYDFTKLIKILPELSRYVNQNSYGNLSIDFADPMAVKQLNKALLLNDYQINYWDIPDGFLCPPIPGRSDYIHYLADLLAQDNQNSIPTGKQIRVLDIGVGANVIYPIIGCA